MFATSIQLSLQEAFALSDADAASAPANYVVPLRAAGRKYNVYVHRCAPYGQHSASQAQNCTNRGTHCISALAICHGGEGTKAALHVHHAPAPGHV